MGVNSFLQPNCGCCKITASISGCNVTLSWGATGDSASIDGYGAVALVDSMTIPHLANSYTLRVPQCNGREKTCSVSTPGCFLSGTKYDAATGVYSDFANSDTSDSTTRLCGFVAGGAIYITYTRDRITGAAALNHSFGPYDFVPGDCNLDNGAGGLVSFNTYLGSITHIFDQTWEFRPYSGPSTFTDYQCTTDYDVYSRINHPSSTGDRPSLFLEATSASSIGSGVTCYLGVVGAASCGLFDYTAQWGSPFGSGVSDIASGGNASQHVSFLTPGKFTWSLTPCS